MHKLSFKGAWPNFKIAVENLIIVDFANLESHLCFFYDFCPYRAKGEYRFDDPTLFNLIEDQRYFPNDPNFKPFYNIYISGENVFAHSFYRASHGFMNENMDLVLSQQLPSQIASLYNNCLEFPMIIKEMFYSHPQSGLLSLAELEDRLAEIEAKRSPAVFQRKHFWSMVARHDCLYGLKGIRDQLVHILEQMIDIPIVFPGRYRNNSSVLTEDYKDDKIAFLTDCCINICPENSYAPSYVTEKLWHCLRSGALPIYWGGIKPLSHIFNPQAMFYFDPRKPRDFIDYFADFINEAEVRQHFFSQKIFMPGAAALIFIEYLYPLYKKVLSTSLVGDINTFRLKREALPNYDLEADYQRALDICKELKLSPRMHNHHCLNKEEQYPFTKAEKTLLSNYIKNTDPQSTLANYLRKYFGEDCFSPGYFFK